MRTIRFRGKTLATNKWIYGSLLLLGDTTYIVENKVDLSPQGCVLHEVKKESVGQLVMTNNEGEYYEGDINNHGARLIWWGVEYIWEQPNGFRISLTEEEDTSVHGNEVDNPELFQITN